MIMNFYILHKNNPVLPHWPINSRIYDGLRPLTPRVYRGSGGRCKISSMNFFLTPEPREVLRWNFGLVSKITLGIFFGQTHTTSLVSANVQMTHFETWLHFKDLLQYLEFYIDFLVSEIWDILQPWNFLKNVFWQKMLLGDMILNFYWCYQKLVSGLYSTYQSRDLVHDINNHHLFIREIPGTNFRWDTRVMVYTPLSMYTMLEKTARWKLWYFFESLALQYSLENLLNLLTLSFYFTWWHLHFYRPIRKVTEVLKMALKYL